MTDWNKIRSQFPAFEDCTYINTAATGLIPERSIHRMTHHYEALASRGAAATEEWVVEMEDVRNKVARLINADPYEVAIVPNMATALNWLAPMLKPLDSVGFVEGDFPTLKSSWVIQGFETKEAPVSPNGMISYEDIQRLDTNILAISHVQWHTGFKVDLDVLREITKEKGQLLIVDATQSLGACEIDVKARDIDVLLVSCYKWMVSGFGNCIVYVKKELLEKYPSKYAWQYRAFFQGYGEVFPDARRFEIGHERHDAFFRLGESIDLMNEIGSANIEERVNGLRDYFYLQMEKNGIPLESDYASGFRSQIAIVQGGEEEEKRLTEKGIHISNRGTGLRVALHFYNNEDDVDKFVEVMKGE